MTLRQLNHTVHDEFILPGICLQKIQIIQLYADRPIKMVFIDKRVTLHSLPSMCKHIFQIIEFDLLLSFLHLQQQIFLLIQCVLLVFLLNRRLNGCIQLHFLDGLQQITVHPIANRPMCIVKFFIPANYNEPNIIPTLFTGCNQSQPVQFRHFYVCQDDIRCFLANDLQCSLPIFQYANQFYMQLLPMD